MTRSEFLEQFRDTPFYFQSMFKYRLTFCPKGKENISICMNMDADELYRYGVDVNSPVYVTDLADVDDCIVNGVNVE